MTIATIILLLVMCLLIALIVVMAKMLRSDDFAEDDVIATYPENEGMAPSRMVQARDKFCLVYEDQNSPRYGMGVGTTLDDMELIYNGDNAEILDIKGQDDYILWSEKTSEGIATKVYFVSSGEINELCVKQNADVVCGNVGLYDYWAYFCELDEDGKKVNLVGYNLETGDERTVENVPVVDGVAKPIKKFTIVHNIMNIIEQDLTHEIKLVATDLSSLIREEKILGVTGYPDAGKTLVVDDVVDVTPNLMRMTYMTFVRQNGKGVIYEIGDKRVIKCAMIDDEFEAGSPSTSQGIAYWIENVDMGDALLPCLYGYNTASRQLIITITGVSSFIVDDDDLYYFHENPETGKLSLCKRNAAGNIKTLDMAAAKAEYKAKKKAKKNNK